MLLNLAQFVLKPSKNCTINSIMDFEIKQLNENHLDVVSDFLLKQNTFLRFDTIIDDDPMKHISTGNKKMFGAFLDNELVSTLGASYSGKDNSYFISSAKTLPKKFNYFNFAKNGLGALWETIIQHSEEMEYYTFYILHNLNRWPTKKIQETGLNDIPSYKRYYGAVHSIIPANTQPVFEMHWNMMGQRTYPSDLVLLIRILKSIHHPSNYYVHNLFEEGETR